MMKMAIIVINYMMMDGEGLTCNLVGAGRNRF